MLQISLQLPLLGLLSRQKTPHVSKHLQVCNLRMIFFSVAYFPYFPAFSYNVLALPLVFPISVLAWATSPRNPKTPNPPPAPNLEALHRIILKKMQRAQRQILVDSNKTTVITILPFYSGFIGFYRIFRVLHQIY